MCFGCHYGDPGQPPLSDGVHIGGAFSPAAASSHRVGSTGRPDLQSLRGTKPASLDCGSCHDSGGSGGLRGPHVSDNPSLLVRSYAKGDGAMESPAAYALCYGCHARESLLANESFPLHREHVLGLWDAPGALPKARGSGLSFQDRSDRGGAARRPGSRRRKGAFGMLRTPTSCSTCHDPHGSQEFPSLVVFDRQIVYPNSQGRLRFLRLGPGSGACNLFCHGYDHVDERY